MLLSVVVLILICFDCFVYFLKSSRDILSVPTIVVDIMLVTLIPVAVLFECCHIGSLTWARWLKYVETTSG